MSQEPLRAYWVTIISDAVLDDHGNKGRMVTADTEEDALQEALVTEGAYRFTTSLTETFSEEVERAGAAYTVEMPSGDFMRIYPESHNRFVNVDKVYSLDEVIEAVESGQLDAAPLRLARLEGQLEAYIFVENLLAENPESQTGREKPAFIKRNNFFYPLSDGEKVYNSQANQIWPADPPGQGPQ